MVARIRAGKSKTVTFIRAAVIAAWATPFGTASSKPCSDSDWQFGFSVCEESAGAIGGRPNRSRGVFAYAPADACDPEHPNSQPRPSPLLQLPCEHPCEVGERLAVSFANDNDLHVDCRACEPGSYSLGGGTVVDGSSGGWIKPWPKGLSTFCMYKDEHGQWQPGGSANKVCLLHVVVEAAPSSNVASETRPGNWNDQLQDDLLEFPLVLPPENNLLACEPMTDPGTDGQFNGAIVLVLRGNCTFQLKTQHAEAAGAKAVVVYNNVANAPYFVPAAANESDMPHIPIFMITKEDGERWVSVVKAAQPRHASLRVPSIHCAANSLEPAPAPSVVPNATSNTYGSWYSSQSHGCAPWAADRTGQYLHSGNNLRNHWIFSILSLSTNFARDGHLAFVYRVDSEASFDGLTFYMDDAGVFPLASRELVYKRFEVRVPRGEHVFQWTYTKDSTGSVGTDRVQIQFLEVSGTSYADLECQPCRSGDARSGSGHCAYCGRNEYLAVNQFATANETQTASYCEICPSGTWSLPGSVGRHECYDRRACRTDDIEVTYSAADLVPDALGANGYSPDCWNNKTKVSHRWREPMICNPSLTGSVVLPSPSERQTRCPPCQPHQRRGSYGGACTPVTLTCPHGTHAVRQLEIDRWHVWPPNISTEVSGPFSHSINAGGGSVSHHAGEDPLRRGWQLGSDGRHAIVGAAFSVLGEFAAKHEAQVEAALLHLDVALDSPGNLSFEFTPEPISSARHWSEQDIEDLLQVNGTYVKSARLVYGAGGLLLASVELPVGSHRVTWAWRYDADAVGLGGTSHDDGTMAVSNSGMRLMKVSVKHAIGAGAIGCEPCPSGHEIAPNGMACLPCLAGRSSKSYGASNGAVGCFPCPAGRASVAPGQGDCKICGAGLRSAEGAVRCEPITSLSAQPSAEDSGDSTQAQQWSVSALVDAWNRSTGGLAHLPLKVEDRYFYLNPFSAIAEASAFVQAPDGGGQLGYWWERIAPRSAGGVAPATFGTPLSNSIAGANTCEDAASLRIVGDVIESLVAQGGSFSDASRVGVWATFAGTCSHGAPNNSTTRTARLFMRCDTAAKPPEDRGGDGLVRPSGPSSGATTSTSGNLGWRTLQGLGFMDRQQFSSAGSCDDITLEWATSAACPLCREMDYAAVHASECLAGKRFVQHLPMLLCAGGVPAPADSWEPCDDASGGIGLALASVVIVFAVCCFCAASCSVYLLRKRYRKYMILEEPQAPSIGTPAAIGASAL